MTHIPPLRVAVVGCGAFGALHARTLAGLAEAQLIALCDNDRARSAALASELRVPAVFDDPAALFAAGLAEAVVISTRTATHVSLAQAALAAGLHVLVEKPVGASIAEIESLGTTLAALPDTHRRIVMAGHITLFHSLLPPLMAQVARHGFRAAHLVRYRDTGHVMRHPGEHPMRLTMVHDLVILGQMVQGEEPVAIEGWDARGTTGHAHAAWAMLRWADGRVATLQSHWLLPAGSPTDGYDRIDVWGDGYEAAANTNPQPLSIAGDKMQWPHGLEIGEIHGRPVGMLSEEWRSFCAACRTGTVPAGCRLEDALQIEHWIEKLLASAASR